MAQTSVTNFFASRKRGGDIHASKRRKVQRLTQDDDSGSQTIPESVNAAIQSTKSGKGDLNVPALLPDSETEVSFSNTKKSQARVRSTRKASTSTRSSQRTKSKATGQKDIKEFLSTILSAEDKTKDVLPEPEATAACDDHSSSPPCTPTKRTSAEPPQKHGQKRSRPTVRKDLFSVKTPDAYDFTKYAEKSPEKERLVMKGRRLSEEGSSSQKLGILPDPGEVTAVQGKKEVIQESAKAVKESKTTSKKTEKVQLLKGKTKEADSTSTPAESEPKITEQSKTKADIPEKITVKQKLPASKEIAGSSKNNVEVSQTNQDKVSGEKTTKQKAPPKLSTNKLAELKQKLMEHNKKKNELEAIKVSRKEKELSKETAPAFERFHNLAQPLPPSLTLPYKYKVLLEKFYNTDSIIGMLHKRNELCTFSKLKAAVQNMSKRAFEERTLAQIKSVYPSAYIFRQEKGIPVFGKGRTTNYQLTVEANLKDDLKGYIHKSKVDEVDSNGKPSLSATRMLERRSVCQRNLLEIVKKHHKEFLNSLPKPLSIPDDKLTRWHPAFKVDEVPDIPLAELPVAPDLKTFSSAADVLQHACIKNNRVKAALEKVASDANQKNIEKGSPKSPAQNIPVAPSPAKSNSQLNGVSQSLLERIRAKEAKKMESTLTRSPAQEHRIQMMSRLPDIIRIVRTVFVTSKKPALPLMEAVERIMDSYRSNLGNVEAEKHVRLMVELLPDWISIVKIKAGEYLKVDKNKDLTNVVNKVNKLLKEAQ